MHAHGEIRISVYRRRPEFPFLGARFPTNHRHLDALWAGSKPHLRLHLPVLVVESRSLRLEYFLHLRHGLFDLLIEISAYIVRSMLRRDRFRLLMRSGHASPCDPLGNAASQSRQARVDADSLQICRRDRGGPRHSQPILVHRNQFARSKRGIGNLLQNHWAFVAARLCVNRPLECDFPD